MENLFTVNFLKGRERLVKIVECRLFANGSLLFHNIAQRFSVNVIHYIIGGLILVEKVIDFHNILTVKPADSLGFFVEFFSLFNKFWSIGNITHADSIVALPLVNSFHEEFFDGHLFVESRVFSQIGVAKTTRRKIAFYAIPSLLKNRAIAEHFFIELFSLTFHI